MRIGIDYTAAVRQRAGIGRYTRELVGALLVLGQAHEYVMFAATGGLERATVDIPRGPNVSVRTVPLTDDWLARVWHRLRLPVPIEMVTGRLDVFYSPDFVLPPLRYETRTVVTVHDLSFIRYPEHFLPRLVEYLERAVSAAVSRADLVLADSEATRNDLLRYLHVLPDQVVVLYSGVSSRFTPCKEPGERERLRDKYAIGEQPYVLAVGTLQPRKNYVRLIRACVGLSLRSAAGRPLQLVIAGGRGWLDDEIWQEASRYSDRVRVLGFVDDADLPALYRNAAVFAFPSLYEGFGLPILEAMACGVPVVCSNSSSMPEVAGQAALLVDPLDTDGWREALLRVLEDDALREEMVKRGVAQAARFTWERAAQQLLPLLTG